MAGARHNKRDQDAINKWHKNAGELAADMLALGASIDEAAEAAPEPEATGNALKTISATDDELRVGNYIVMFGGRDLTGEYFTPKTKFESDYTAIGRLPVDWEHGQQAKADGLGADDVLGYVDWGTAKVDAQGLFVQRVLNRRKEYVKWLQPLIEAGLVGTSSQAVGSQVKKTADGEITVWPLYRDALTVQPAEPRMMGENVIAAMKALGIDAAAGQPASDDAPATATPVPETSVNESEKTMPPEIPVPAVETEAEEPAWAKSLAEELKEVKTKLNAPALPVLGAVITGGDERAAEKPFKSLGENLLAARQYADNHTLPTAYKQYVANLDKSHKALGLNEGVPTEGGVLVQTDFINDLLKPMHETGPFSSRTRRIPVSANANGVVINAVNETSRATGSRWGGVQGYRLAEGGTKLPTKPDFRRMEMRLKKYAVLVYATDELLADAPALESVATQAAREELDFMANDDILNGLGVAGPLGILNSPALVTAAAESGQAADTIVNANLSKMWQRLHPRHRANAAWYINSEAEPWLDVLTIPAGTGAVEPRFVNYGPDGIMRIKGKPVIVTEFNAAAGDVGDILLADLSDYVTIEKGGVQTASSIHVAFLTDETVFRFVFRIDGQPSMNSPITPYKGTLTQSAYVALAAR